MAGVRLTAATVKPGLIGPATTGAGAALAVGIVIVRWVMQEVAQQ